MATKKAATKKAATKTPPSPPTETAILLEGLEEAQARLLALGADCNAACPFHRGYAIGVLSRAADYIRKLSK